MSVVQLPSGRWRLQIRRRRLKVDQLFATEEEALKAEQKYVKAGSSKERGPTLNDAWALYQDSPLYLQKRERTQQTEASRIKRFLKEFGTKSITDISALDVEGYITARLKQKTKPSADAIRLEVAALSALMNFCRDRGYIAANPCRGVRRPAGQIKPRRMSADEEGALIALLRHPNFRFRAAARLCLLVRETGARPGEWRHTTWPDVDLEKERVIFQRTKYRGQPRTVPLTKAAVRLISDQMMDALSQLESTDKENPLKLSLSPFIFAAIGKAGEARPMYYTGALRDAKEKQLLPKSVRAHTGRHEFVSTLLESTDLDDARVMALVGHHSPASMEVYKHVRNVRFLPQLEGLEEMRRKQRAKSLAAALGIPPQTIKQLLLNRREASEAIGGHDEGDELLYTAELLQEVEEVADGLGATPEERSTELMRRLLAVRSWAKTRRSRSPPAEGSLKSTVESASMGARLDPSPTRPNEAAAAESSDNTVSDPAESALPPAVGSK